VHQSLDSIPTADWYASPLTPRFTISPGFGSGSRLLNILFGGLRSQHQHALDTPADIAPTCRSLSLDDTSSAPAALFTSWVRSSSDLIPRVAVPQATARYASRAHICSRACAAASVQHTTPVATGAGAGAAAVARRDLLVQAGANSVLQKRISHPPLLPRVHRHRRPRPQTAPTPWTRRSRGPTATRKPPRPCRQRTPRPRPRWRTT
jgi:hypothetical protein